jgi:hypothetical protein
MVGGGAACGGAIRGLGIPADIGVDGTGDAPGAPWGRPFIPVGGAAPFGCARGYTGERGGPLPLVPFGEGRRPLPGTKVWNE